jgi:uncharacterized protein YneF (UPF0154 family)
LLFIFYLELQAVGDFALAWQACTGTFILSISCGAIIGGFWFIRKQIRNTFKKAGRLYPGKINE